MKTVQIILYNQIHTRYLYIKGVSQYIYIHHTGKIKFQGKNLSLNTYSKVLDYAMGKNFIQELQNDGKKADFCISQSYFDGIFQYCTDNEIKKIVLIEPTEPYVFANFQEIQQKLQKENIFLEFFDDTESFLLSRQDFQKQFKKPPIMEFFYRFMRKKFDILMEGNVPVGGEWNYDKENRKFDKNHFPTKTYDFGINNILKEACEYYQFTPKIMLSTTRNEALNLLDFFVREHLDNFGTLEDAMYQKDDFVHHSLLSTAIHFGLLSPLEVIKKIENTDTALNNKEGFIRQILGWREYVYQFFYFYKDTIYTENYFGFKKNLPSYFWEIDAGTKKMNCVDTVLKKVQTYNYSHHIERLMIIGNFTLLAGYDPAEVNKWFFEMYTDAFEWVVTPNVLSMSQFADGGKLATKPYVASANYINNMSDYCKNCAYDPKEKYGETACPMNYLYWAFVDEQKEVFVKGRQPFILKNLEKIDLEKIHQQKKRFLAIT